jgi:hypothetical protein
VQPSVPEHYRSCHQDNESQCEQCEEAHEQEVGAMGLRLGPLEVFKLVEAIFIRVPIFP